MAAHLGREPGTSCRTHPNFRITTGFHLTKKKILVDHATKIGETMGDIHCSPDPSGAIASEKPISSWRRNPLPVAKKLEKKKRLFWSVLNPPPRFFCQIPWSQNVHQIFCRHIHRFHWYPYFVPPAPQKKQEPLQAWTRILRGIPGDHCHHLFRVHLTLYIHRPQVIVRRRKKCSGERPQTVWGAGSQCARYKQQ